LPQLSSGPLGGAKKASEIMADFKKAFENWARNPVFLAGRDREMATLQSWLLEEHQPAVGIIGPAGIGKTTLAYQFMRHHTEQYPGGTWYLRIPSDELPPPSSAPSLIVLDDAQTASPDKMKILLAHAFNDGSVRQHIVVSREPFAEIPYSLKLSTLDQKDVIDIFHSLLLHASPGDEELLAALANGRPLVAQMLAVIVRDKGLREGLKYLAEFIQSGIVDPAGKPVKSDSAPATGITSGLVIASDEVMRKLAAEPELLHRLSSREFEELVAELLVRQGYDVKLTPISKDGGKDIYVAHKSALGSALYVVECKKYSPDNPVGVKIVRELFGVVQAEQLTGGIVATTSHFTRGAKQFQETVHYQMSLSDYKEVHEWLSRTLGKSKRTA
jgi:restriction system protein